MNQPTKTESGIVNIFVTRTIGAWSIVSGLIILIDGPRRWHTHIFDTLNHMPGSPQTWGIIAIVSGLLVIIGSTTGIAVTSELTLRNIGLWIVAAWCMAFVVGFLWAAFHNSTVSYNVGTTYLLIAILSIFVTKSRFTP